MEYLPIVCYPAEILKHRVQEISATTPEIQALIPRMIHTMYAADGIGLAAPQVGISNRLIIVETAPNPRDAARREKIARKPLPCINPVLVKTKGASRKEEEGCLSLPGIFVQVSRKEHVQVRCQTLEGNEITLEASGLTARIFQHEIDHLNGKLIIDRVGILQRLKLRKQLKALTTKQHE